MSETTKSQATGRRKDACARVHLVPGSGRITVNGRDEAEFFRRETLSMIVRQPLVTIGLETELDVVATVKGGGLHGAAGAVRHAIARALCSLNPEFRTPVKRAGFLTRDPRTKERKKYGQRGARARFQFSKR